MEQLECCKLLVSSIATLFVEVEGIRLRTSRCNLAFACLAYHSLSAFLNRAGVYGLHKSFLRSEDLMKLCKYPGIELQPS